VLFNLYSGKHFIFTKVLHLVFCSDILKVEVVPDVNACFKVSMTWKWLKILTRGRIFSQSAYELVPSWARTSL